MLKMLKHITNVKQMFIDKTNDMFKGIITVDYSYVNYEC